MENQNQQVSTYIQQSLSQGYPEASIRSQLLQSGWQEQMIDAAFQQLYGSTTTAPLSPRTFNPPSSQQPAKKSGLPVWAIVLIVVGGLGIVVAAVVVALSLANAPRLQTKSNNTDRKEDVSNIAGAALSYTESHNGVLPQTTATDLAADSIDICGSDCSGDNKVAAPLLYYKNTPAAISFQTYKNNIKVPNASTIYLVSDSKCKSDGSAIDAQSIGNSPRFLTVLYALQANSGITQQCLDA